MSEPQTFGEAAEQLDRAVTEVWEALGVYPAVRWILNVLVWVIQKVSR